MSGENGTNGSAQIDGQKVKTKDGFDDGVIVEVTLRGEVFYNGTGPEKIPDHVWIRAPGYGPMLVPKSAARIVK